MQLNQSFIYQTKKLYFQSLDCLEFIQNFHKVTMCLFYILLLLVPFIFSQEIFTISPQQNNISNHLIQIINNLDNTQINVVTILRFNEVYFRNVDDIIDDTIQYIRKDISVVVNVKSRSIYKMTRVLIVFYEDGLFKVYNLIMKYIFLIYFCFLGIRYSFI